MRTGAGTRTPEHGSKQDVKITEDRWGATGPLARGSRFRKKSWRAVDTCSPS